MVAKEGRITQRVSLPTSGPWAESVESINPLIGDLVQPTAEVARVIGAVAKGDLWLAALNRPPPHRSRRAKLPHWALACSRRCRLRAATLNSRTTRAISTPCAWAS